MLSGSLFVRNAIKLDYCVRESIASISELCDEVVVLDCQSDDGTTDMLLNYCRGLPNVKYMTNGDWRCANDYTKLKILANACIRETRHPWHFMIQADEVLHENSFEWIREIIKYPSHKNTAYGVRRFNLFGTMDRYISLGMPTKPCSDRPVRLARRHIMAGGDAESLVGAHPNYSYLDKLFLFHYGYVRHDKQNVDKAVEMQSWFFGGNGNTARVDGRLLEMQKRGVWEPEKLIDPKWLDPLPLAHPKFSRVWVSDRTKK